MASTEYTIHDGGHSIEESSLEQILAIVTVEERHSLNTAIRRYVWCDLCEHHVPMVYENSTFEALNDCPRREKWERQRTLALKAREGDIEAAEQLLLDMGGPDVKAD